MKRCLSILLAIALFITLLPGAAIHAASAEEPPAKGTTENPYRVLIWSSNTGSRIDYIGTTVDTVYYMAHNFKTIPDTAVDVDVAARYDAVNLNHFDGDGATYIEFDESTYTKEPTAAQLKTVPTPLYEHYDLVVVYLPVGGFSETDKAVLKDYLDHGGRIFFQLEFAGYTEDDAGNQNGIRLLQEWNASVGVGSKVEYEGSATLLPNKLTIGVNGLHTNVVAALTYSQPAVALAKGGSTTYIVEQAISEGRVTICTDYDYYVCSNITYENNTTEGKAARQFFKNMLSDTADRIKLVEEGGGDNWQFGEGVHYRYLSADGTPLPNAIKTNTGTHRVYDERVPTTANVGDTLAPHAPGVQYTNGNKDDTPVSGSEEQTTYEVMAEDGKTVVGVWTFQGWDHAEVTVTQTEADDGTKTLDPVTFTGTWKYTPNSTSQPALKTYTLSYASNGGTSFVDERHNSGVVVQLDKVPVREGYRFTGWYLDADHTKPLTSVTMTKDITVYAGWKEGSPEDAIAEVLNCEDHFAYVVGYSDGSVRPDAPITRAETATMLYRLLNATHRDEVFTTTSPFPDVTANLWYNKAVSSMANGKYIAGYPDGSFRGGQEITRAEFVTMLTRFVGPSANAVCSFPDVDANYWAYPYIAAAEQYGWVKGYQDGTFRPEDSISRAEVMTVLNRLLNRGVGETGVLSGYRAWPDNEPSAWYYWDVVEATSEHEYTGARPDEQWSSLNANWVYDIAKYEHPEA